MDSFFRIFEHNFNFNQVYSRQDITDFIQTQGSILPYHNAMAYTYNRVNKGMHRGMIPVFENVGYGKYKYLGPNYNYTGILEHYPHDSNQVFAIGDWKEGNLSFREKGIGSFEDWRDSGNDGVQISKTENFMVLADTNSGKKIFKKLVDKPYEKAEGETKDGIFYSYCGITTTLGKLIANREINSQFEFGGSNYQVEMIH